MSPPLNRVALVDTGFWYAVFDERDQHYRDAQSRIDSLLRLKYILPWPVIYETLRTRFVRRQTWLRKFEHILKRPNAIFLDDCTYRAQAMAHTLMHAGARGRPRSLGDNVLRLVVEDRNVTLHCLFSFNRADFVDVCSRRRIELI